MIEARLDYSTRTEWYDVHAFHARKKIALVQRMFTDDPRPFKVYQGFGFMGVKDNRMTWEEEAEFDDLNRAYEYYEEVAK